MFEIEKLKNREKVIKYTKYIKNTSKSVELYKKAADRGYSLYFVLAGLSSKTNFSAKWTNYGAFAQSCAGGNGSR